jgi:hypothetical protein
MALTLGTTGLAALFGAVSGFPIVLWVPEAALAGLAVLLVIHLVLALPSPKPKGVPTQIVAPTASPENIVTATDDTNTLPDVFKPQDRVVLDSEAAQIESALRSFGLRRYFIINYTGGEDAETRNYSMRIAEILNAAGWLNIENPYGLYQRTAGPPMSGITFIYSIDTSLDDPSRLAKIFSSHGVPALRNGMRLNVRIPGSDVIGLLIDKAPE